MTNIPKPIEKSKTANIIETNGVTKDWKLRKSKIKNLIYLIMKTFSFCCYLKVEKQDVSHILYIINPFKLFLILLTNSFYSSFGTKFTFKEETLTTEIPTSTEAINVEDLEKQLFDVLDQLAGKYEKDTENPLGAKK